MREPGGRTRFMLSCIDIATAPAWRYWSAAVASWRIMKKKSWRYRPEPIGLDGLRASDWLVISSGVAQPRKIAAPAIPARAGFVERANCLCAVASIDVAPAVPVALLGVILPVGKGSVLFLEHDVAEAHTDDLGGGARVAMRLSRPANVLLCQRLAYELRERVGALGEQGALLGDGQLGRSDIEWDADERLAAGHDNVADTQLAASFEHIVGRGNIGVELLARRALTGRGHGGEMNHRLHALVGHVDLAKRLENLTHVRQVNLDEAIRSSKTALAVLGSGLGGCGVGRSMWSCRAGDWALASARSGEVGAPVRSEGRKVAGRAVRSPVITIVARGVASCSAS
ncbi:hypothetical protein L1887_59879 [Cichorium endivia]|nr:hypothetical protein L1887_59879 [Cichorium endivia]